MNVELVRVFAHKNTTKWHEYKVMRPVDGTNEAVALADLGYTRVDVVEKRKVLSTEPEIGGVELSGSILRIQWGLLDVDKRSKPTVYIYKEGDTKGEVLFGIGEEVEIELLMQPDERPLP